MKSRKGEKVLTLLSVVSLIFLVYFGASFADTIKHNDPLSTGYQDYAEWNLFTILEEMIQND